MDTKRPTVPKFGSWDNDDVGYTVYFDKVRKNKGATAPPLLQPHKHPNDPEEGPMMRVPPPLSLRPATAGGHREHDYRRTESSSAMFDQGFGHQSMFAPPPQYYQYQRARNPQPQAHHHGSHHHHHHGGGHQQQRPLSSHGHGNGHRASHAHRHHQHAAQGPRARSASPQSNAPNRQRPSAVPRFGVWDEQNAEAASQGFTVMFENVKRSREEARYGMRSLARVPSPPEGAALRRHHQKTPFVSKMFGCFIPTPPAKS